MQWVETTGKTVEEAKDLALDQLGVAEDDAEFEVIEEPKAGLFGRLRSEARVRARVKPRAPRSKDRRERRRRPRQPDRREERDDTERTSTGAEAASDDEGGAMEDLEDVEDVAITRQAEVAQAFLTGLVEEFGRPANVAIREIDEETVEVFVDGDDLGLLVGPRGATLDAIQELSRTVVQRQTGARHGRLLVDVAGYRRRRREALERFTRTLAAEVKESGARKLLEPMNPADRKVVHDTVNTIDGVRTVSEGEDPRRRVVILPDGSA